MNTIKEITVAQPSKFVAIKQREDIMYQYAERLGKDSVAFILFDKEKTTPFGMTVERKPPMDFRAQEEQYISEINQIEVNEKGEVFLPTAFGGSNDQQSEIPFEAMSKEDVISHMKNIVVGEVREEGGYNIDPSRVKFISTEFVSTQQNQMCFMFIVDITGIPFDKTDPENEMEAMARTVWASKETIFAGSDWKSKVIVASI